MKSKDLFVMSTKVLFVRSVSKVYEEPKMLSSCEHVFCFGCIEKYIINGNHCPLDQKPIDSSHIEDAPKCVARVFVWTQNSLRFS